MAEIESHAEPVLKVSDRRHFTDSGERRTDVEASAFEERPAPPPDAPAATAKESKDAKKDAKEAKDAKTAAAPPARAERLAAREINFTGLVQDLFATGMMQLGAELQPGQPAQLDLEGARETIDLLGLLQQKTQGNLDTQEERVLAGALYELRLGYVEVLRQATAPPVMPPPPRRR
ncbi:MAG: DUF1844 domain-containing protein [Terriglobales bacterium]